MVGKPLTVAACDLLTSFLTSILPQNKRLLAVEKMEDDAAINEDDLRSQLQSDKKMAGLKLMVTKKEQPVEHKKKDDKKKKDKKAEEKKPEAPVVEDDSEDPNKKLIFDLQIRNAFSQLKVEPPTINKDLSSAIDVLEKRRSELDQQVKSKEKEITELRAKAEASVPSIDELKERFKDAPTRERDGEKGTHGHKERRGARGGRGGRDRDEKDNTQWKGGRPERHPRREGDQEKADIEQNEEDQDSFEEQNRRREKDRKAAPKKANLAEGDFPKL